MNIGVQKHFTEETLLLENIGFFFLQVALLSNLCNNYTITTLKLLFSFI